MKQRFLVPGLILVGLCLLGLGIGWNRIVPPTAYWGSKQAQEYATAQADLHAKSHTHGHDSKHQQEVVAAKERFINAYQQLQHARGSRNRTGTVLMAGGVGLLLLGIVLHLAAGRPG